MLRQLSLFALALAGCSLSVAQSGSSQAAVVGGTTDTTDTSVVLVYVTLNNGDATLCSGEVISPHVVLTAAHCVAPASLGTTTAQFAIYLGDSLANDMEAANPNNVVGVASTDYDHAFDPHNISAGHDVGVLVTTTALPSTPLALNQTPLPQSDLGATVKLVGFGITSGSDTMGATAGTRRSVSATITDLESTLVRLGSAQAGNCEGDSGGPAIMSMSGVDTIVGIASFGAPGCDSGSLDSLVDAYWSSIIQPTITAAESGMPVGVPVSAPTPAGPPDMSPAPPPSPY